MQRGQDVHCKGCGATGAVFYVAIVEPVQARGRHVINGPQVGGQGVDQVDGGRMRAKTIGQDKGKVPDVGRVETVGAGLVHDLGQGRAQAGPGAAHLGDANQAPFDAYILQGVQHVAAVFGGDAGQGDAAGIARVFVDGRGPGVGVGKQPMTPDFVYDIAQIAQGLGPRNRAGRGQGGQVYRARNLAVTVAPGVDYRRPVMRRERTPAGVDYAEVRGAQRVDVRDHGPDAPDHPIDGDAEGLG